MQTSRSRNPFVYPIYPWLLVTYFIVFLFSQNISIVRGIEVIYVLVAGWVIVGIALGIVYALTRQLYKAALTVAMISLVFLMYGHVLDLVPSGTGIGNKVMYVVLGVLVAVLIAAIWRLKKAGTVAKRLALPANIFMAVLLIMPLFQIVQYYSLRPAPMAYEVTTPAPKINDSAERPDIYYIILDGYSSNAHLLRDYGYDNSDFTDALEERGFFVAYNSTSNYGATLGSLPAVLNMRYFNEEDARNKGALGAEYAREMLSYNRVAADLREQGYTYINMMSGFTAPSPIADENVDFYPSGMQTYALSGDDSVPDCAPTCFRQSFISFFLYNTMLRPVISNTLGEPTNEPYIWNDYRRQLAMWQAAPAIAERDEATFAFVHIIKPHVPIVFGANGEIQPALDNDAPAFFRQIQFVNQQTLAMLDEILEKSAVPPIIIVQGDHGTHLGLPWDPTGKHLSYFEILNAFYWPGAPDGTIPDDMTSINTFRLLFNTYFDTDYEMLEDRHFDLIGGYSDLFNMVEVDVAEVIANRPKPELSSPINSTPEGLGMP